MDVEQLLVGDFLPCLLLLLMAWSVGLSVRGYLLELTDHAIATTTAAVRPNKEKEREEWRIYDLLITVYRPVAQLLSDNSSWSLHNATLALSTCGGDQKEKAMSRAVIASIRRDPKWILKVPIPAFSLSPSSQCF